MATKRNTKVIVENDSGYVGIGTNNPTRKLDVIGRIHTTDEAVQVYDTNSTRSIVLAPANNGYYGLPALYGLNGAAIDDISINPAGGNVGIGTTNPSEKLHVNDGNLRVDRGSSSSIITLGGSPSNNWEGDVQFVTSNSETNWRLASNRVVPGAFTITPSSTAGGNTFTTPNMTILPNGNVGIGVSPSRPFEVLGSGAGTYAGQISNSSSTDPYGLGVFFTNASPNNTTQQFFGAGDSTTTRFLVYSNGNVVNSNNSYGAISDVRLKENIVDTTPKLDDLLKVKIKNYNLIGDNKKQIGVVAQELEEVFPGMIDESTMKKKNEAGEEVKEVYKSVKYSVFIPILIKSIQEQQEIINDLKARIEILENK